jgi:hypothetical protein
MPTKLQAMALCQQESACWCFAMVHAQLCWGWFLAYGDKAQTSPLV